MKTIKIIGLFLIPMCSLAYWLSPVSPKDTPALPKISEIDSVHIDQITNNSNHFHATEPFLQSYSKLKPNRVNHALGISRIWQTGKIILTNKKEIPWRTCDKRFILIDEGTNAYSYTICGDLDLEKR